MNLHAIANPVIQVVNPNVRVDFQESRGVGDTQDNGDTAPVYGPKVARSAQVQPLGSLDIRQIEGLNLSGTKQKIYLNGLADGLVRINRKGGDLVTLPDGNVWLVAHILEQYPDWVSAVIVLQNQGRC